MSLLFNNNVLFYFSYILSHPVTLTLFLPLSYDLDSARIPFKDAVATLTIMLFAGSDDIV